MNDPTWETMERVRRLEYGPESVLVPVWYCKCRVSVHGRFSCGICGEPGQRGEAWFDNPYAQGPVE
jgi:hypothetical protein